MIDMLASSPHYADHIAPVFRSLPDGLRGDYVDPHGRPARPSARLPEPVRERGLNRDVLVAGYADVKRARREGYGRIVLMQHGTGQSYSDTEPSYPGGDHQGDVSLFLCPNQYSAARWVERYPDAEVAIIGSPRVEHLPKGGNYEGPPVVAVSSHWNCNLYPETRPTWGYYKKAIQELTKQYRVIGHGHPRAMAWLRPWYESWGVEVVEDFEEVLVAADIYVCDNSSTIYEFAAVAGAVVVLNSPQYRKHIDHGGRFWDWATVGVQVDTPEALPEAVRLALLDPYGLREERERIVKMVYSSIVGSTAAAVGVLEQWA